MVSFVILTWNSVYTIEECLNSIMDRCKQENINYEVLVMDNGSTDETVSIVKEKFKEMPIKLTVYDRNLGTTYPRNNAFKNCSGEVICILDSDATFKKGSLKDVIEKLSDEQVGIVAPMLLLNDGSVQNSVKKFPSLMDKMMKIPKVILKLKIKDYDFYEEFPFEAIREVDMAISACWFFRSSLIKEVGYLDEKIYYAPEDLDYCLRVRKSGKTILYYPFFTVLHYTQQISHKKMLSKIAFSHFKGLIYYFYKHKYVRKPVMR